MKPSTSRLPNLTRRVFARTNVQTIAQRVMLLRELVPDARAVTEICCGDCSRQHQAYTGALGIRTFRGLDIEPTIVTANQATGIECYQGDALDANTLRHFIHDDVIFFGPPLSEDCDGHRLLNFGEVLPSYSDFTRLLLGELRYDGLLVCICPNFTNLGDITRLYQEIRTIRPDFNLPLIHHSYSTLTGNNEVTELRLKYIELWFSNRLEDLWEVRESRGGNPLL
jgi:hypothetical protein